MCHYLIQCGQTNAAPSSDFTVCPLRCGLSSALNIKLSIQQKIIFFKNSQRSRRKFQATATAGWTGATRSLCHCYVMSNLMCETNGGNKWAVKADTGRWGTRRLLRRIHPMMYFNGDESLPRPPPPQGSSFEAELSHVQSIGCFIVMQICKEMK